MKFQPRRFVVEVKRGTSRAAFTSADTVSTKFSSAEDLLFGGRSKAVSAASPAREAASGKPAGRILNSLIEPPPPVIEDVPERPRRGRKPGSKNKPKLPLIAQAAPPSEPILLPKAKPASDPLRRGASEEAPIWREHVIPAEVATPSVPPVPRAEPALAAPVESRSSRTRLRDRSSIIKRYVLDSEPRAGQPGWLRARKAARAAR